MGWEGKRLYMSISQVSQVSPVPQISQAAHDAHESHESHESQQVSRVSQNPRNSQSHEIFQFTFFLGLYALHCKSSSSRKYRGTLVRSSQNTADCGEKLNTNPYLEEIDWLGLGGFSLVPILKGQISKFRMAKWPPMTYILQKLKTARKGDALIVILAWAVPSCPSEIITLSYIITCPFSP